MIYRSEETKRALAVRIGDLLDNGEETEIQVTVSASSQVIGPKEAVERVFERLRRCVVEEFGGKEGER